MSDYALFPKDRFATASDGTRLAYTIVGDGPRIPILFVNGWSCTDAYWVGIGPGVIADGHRAIFMDTRGHVDSGLPRPEGFLAHNIKAEDVSVERMALDVVTVLDDAGIDKAALAGHSMGVQIIFETWRQAPERVAALIPIAGAFENPVKTFADIAFLDRLYPFAEILFGYIPFELMRPITRRVNSPQVAHRMMRLIRVGGPKITPEHVAAHGTHITEVNFSVLWKMMNQMRKHRMLDELPRIDVPVLVLAGERDFFTPPSVQRTMQEKIPGAEVVWFPEAGHLLPVEEPEGIVTAIDDFFRRRFPDDAADTDKRPGAGITTSG